MSTALLQTQNRSVCPTPNGVCFISIPNSRLSGIEYAKKHKSTFLGFALTEVLLGIFSIGLGIAMIPICKSNWGCDDIYSDYGFWTKFSATIWGGALVIVFGSFGLAQVCQPSTCTIVTNLTLSIFGAITTFAIFGLEVTAACSSTAMPALVILHGIAGVLYFILFIIFLVGSSHAGVARGCCCMNCCWDQYDNIQFVDTIPVATQAAPTHVVNFPSGQTYVLQGPHGQGVAPYPRQPPNYTPVSLHAPEPLATGQFVNPVPYENPREMPMKAN